ncbi:PQQ-binding-like beta-propeller repeat protein [Cohnella terricola]|nr:PQQ-binding-like beta-propeller repeat protein [Cohnella terricola]
MLISALAAFLISVIVVPAVAAKEDTQTKINPNLLNEAIKETIKVNPKMELKATDIIKNLPIIPIENRKGTIRWEREFSSSVNSSVTVGEDGVLYLVTFDNVLYALQPDGTFIWGLGLLHGLVNGKPAIGPDGTIYVNTWDHLLIAVNPDGTKKWEFKRGGSEKISVGGRSVNSSPAVGVDGTIYIAASDEPKLIAVNPDGMKKWEFTVAGAVSTPVLDADGTIYIGSTDSHLYAIKPDGKKKWSFTVKAPIFYSDPVLGADGTIYVVSYDSFFYAVNPDGTKQWSYDYKVRTTPAVGADGTIYVGGNKRLIAVNPNGKIKWELAGSVGGYTNPQIGTDGTIYFTHRAVGYAVNPNGSVKWEFEGLSVGNELAIGSDGSVYTSGTANQGNILYALGTVASSIKINKSAVALKAGESETLIATVMPEDAPNKRVKWSSSDKTVAAVDSGGKVTGIAPGKAKIIATAEDGGFIAVCNVTVSAAAIP